MMLVWVGRINFGKGFVEFEENCERPRLEMVDRVRVVF
jgi:hypothetical protein